ncbi:MAG TPA: TraR/DksA C4-type zinc finger protein [Acidimicrobiales bacterium]|jgi:RNA polymerase-binding transcription factor DksA
METDEAPVQAPEQRTDNGGSGSVPDGFHTSEVSIDAVDDLLDEVEGALTRLDDGTYGLCESCGTPIEDARLADSPTVRSCSACVSPG